MKLTAALVFFGQLAMALLILGSGSGCNSAPTEEASVQEPAAPSVESPLKRSAAARESDAPPAPPITPVFREVAAASGIDFTHFSDPVPGRFFLPEVMGSGVAWIDYDGDGRLDLFFGNGCQLEPQASPAAMHTSRLYRNLGRGRFADATMTSQGCDRRFAQGCAVGDYDADGFPDLYIACFGPDALLHNNGDGTFTRVADSGGASDDDWSSSAAWFDADDDGDLDLYVVNYLDVTLANKKICYYEKRPGYCGPGEYHAVPDRLWINEGDGTFVDRLTELGMSVPNGKGLAITIVDLDLDARPEVYIANDMDSNLLFTRGDAPLAGKPADGLPRRWAEVGTAAGCAVSGMGLNEASMGISCADFDGDGLPDLYLTHYFNAKNTFYRNLGGLSFQDDSFRTRVAATSFQSLGFGTVPLDFDRDGQCDLFLANGHVLGPEIPPYEMEPQLLWNERAARFHDVTNVAGDYFRQKWLGRSAAGADYDQDGDLDIVVSHLLRPAALLRNDTQTDRHYLGFDLRTLNRVPPTGARVVLHLGDREQTLLYQAGGSYLASPDSRLLAGLRDAAGPVRVTVYWPSGLKQELPELALDRYWTLYEGAAPQLVLNAAESDQSPDDVSQPTGGS
ncbi:MAG: CRTAC1 family protein [Pirellulales bacterium]